MPIFVSKLIVVNILAICRNCRVWRAMKMFVPIIFRIVPYWMEEVRRRRRRRRPMARMIMTMTSWIHRSGRTSTSERILIRLVPM